MKLSRFLSGSLRLEGLDLLTLLGWWAGGFVLTELLGQVIFLLIRDPEDTYFQIAPLILLILAVFLLVFLVAGRFSQSFSLGIQMGVTRRRMLLAIWLISLLEMAEILLLCALSFWLDRLIFTSLYGPIMPWDDVFFLIPWWGWLLMAAAPLILGFISGALLARYGIRGFWVLWGICVGGALLFQLVEEPILFLLNNFALPLGILGAAALAVLTVFSFWALLHFPVKQS